jgi:hypothetical protein
MRRTALLLIALGLACSSSSSGGNHGGAGGSGGAGGGGAGGSGGVPTPSTGGSGGGQAGAGGSGGGGSGGSAGSGGSGGTGGSGGGGVDAAPPSGNDGGGETGAAVAAGCQGVSAAFCDDFEKQAAGQQPSGMFAVRQAKTGSIVVDGTKFFSGKQSLLIKMASPAPDTAAQLVFTKQLPLPSNDLHGRAMVFMTAVPGCCSTSNGLHWDLSSASGAGGIEYTVGSMYGNFMGVYQPGDCSLDTQTRVPAGRWACVQWEFKGAKDGTHYLGMKVDGQPTSPDGVSTIGPANCVQGAKSREWKATTWTELTVGWINFQPSTPVEMWIDDLAFGEQEIPCPPAPAK